MVETCELCLCEVFNLWAFCQECSKSKEQLIVCIKCFRSHLSHCYNPRMQFIFYKYEANDLLRFVDRLNFRLKYDNQMDCSDLKESQVALQKNTKDNKSIAEKMKSKVIQTEDLILLKDYHYLYNNLHNNDISSLLIPLIDPDKLTSEDFRLPLKSSNDVQRDPYIDYEDLYYEEYNKQRFSPICAKVNHNKEDDLDIDFIFLGEDSIANEYKQNLFEINSNNGRLQSLNSSGRMSPKNNLKSKTNSHLPGRAFFERVEAPDTFDVRSSKGFFKPDVTKYMCPSSPRGQSNIFSLVSDVHVMKKLKKDLLLLNEEKQSDKEKEVDLKMNNEDFCVMDVFNGMFSTDNNTERKNSDEKKNSLQEVSLFYFLR